MLILKSKGRKMYQLFVVYYVPLEIIKFFFIIGVLKEIRVFFNASFSDKFLNGV